MVCVLVCVADLKSPCKQVEETVHCVLVWAVCTQQITLAAFFSGPSLELTGGGALLL